MELLFLAQTAAPAPGASNVFADLFAQVQAESGPLLGSLLLWIGLLQIVAVIAYWIASKFVANRRDFDDFGEVTYGTFKNALKVYVLHLLLLVVLGVVIYLRLPALAMYGQAAQSAGTSPGVIGLGTILLIGGVLLLVIAFTFIIPMRIYRIGFVRALVFLLIASGISWLGQFALGRVIEDPVAKLQASLVTIAQKKPGDRGSFTALMAQSAQESAFDALEKSAADRSKTFPQRHDALKSLYGKLETMRAALIPGDAAAIGAYEKRRARYEQLLKQVQTDFAAQPAP